MNQKKIELYKVREFGSKFNATIEYIRYNLGPLLKISLLIVAPLSLLFGIIFREQFLSFFALGMNSGAGQMDESQAFSMLSGLMTSYAIMTFVSMITLSFLLASIFSYMKLNNEQEEKPTVMEVFSAMLPKVPKLLVLLVLCGIVSGIGFMIFMIPGVYLAIVLSIAAPILIFEDESVGTAFSKSFKLISGKWWSTFGLLVVSSIIAGIVSYIFLIPFYALTIGNMFTIDPGNDPEAFMEVFSSWTTVIGLSIAMVGSYITYMIPTIALAFQYFNLSERQEGRGIRNKIDEFESVA